MVVGDFPLRDKICIVTGGGSGINLSFVKLALQSGARVLIPDLRLTAEAAELINGSKGNAAFMKCDVSKWTDLEAIPSEVEKAFGKGAVADVWVPGAGIFEPKWSSFLYDEEKEFYMQMRINAEHPIKLTRIAMRSCLGANKPGVVMLVASGAGITGTYAAALYCATKHAVVGFCKSMAQADADENIKVVCICPGMVATPLWTGDNAKHVNSQFSYTDDVCITSDEVAEGMKDMIESPKYKGGALMECRKGNLRGDLPSAQSVIVEDMEPAAAEKFFGTLYQPLREVFKKERGVAANGT
jgi:NAD(P)-dependent dehydrogenase (short-subunit alcohol dehydrogenase family)